MTVNMDYVTLYDRRLNLVKTALKDHSKLSDKASLDIATHVLEALDHIPEKVR